MHLQSGEDVFFFEDDVIFVVEFDVGGRVLFENDFVTFFDGFDVGADGFDDGVSGFFFGLAEQNARFSLSHRFFLEGDDAIL